MATVRATKLDAIAIEEVNGQPAHMLFSNDDVWGFVVKVVFDDEFQGFQVVRWTGDTPRTTRLTTWHRVQHLMRSPERADIDYPRWQECTDWYAEDVLAADAAAFRRRRDAHAAAKAALAAERALKKAKRAAVEARATVTYHGSQDRAHGVGRIVGWCECDDCDELERGDWRVVIEVGQYTVHHARLRSFSLTDEAPHAS
jgi:hypothetical protein